MQDAAPDPRPTPERLRSALLDLHRELLSAQVIELERATGRKMGPNEVLASALEDPRMAWLRELSGLAARLDGEIATAAAENRAVDLIPVAREAGDLISPPNPDQPFGSNYLRSLQRNPAVVMAHRDLTSLLERLDGASR